MNVFEYCTLGGKNLIENHFKSLEIHIYTRYLDVKNLICDGDIHVFELLDTKHITGKIYEIRVLSERIFYVVNDYNVYLLHACHKQKNKTEKKDIDLAISRAKKYSLL